MRSCNVWEGYTKIRRIDKESFSLQLRKYSSIVYVEDNTRFSIKEVEHPVQERIHLAYSLYLHKLQSNSDKLPPLKPLNDAQPGETCNIPANIPFTFAPITPQTQIQDVSYSDQFSDFDADLIETMNPDIEETSMLDTGKDCILRHVQENQDGTGIDELVVIYAFLLEGDVRGELERVRPFFLDD